MTEPLSASGSSADIDREDLILGLFLGAVRGQTLVAVELDQRHRRAEALLAFEEAQAFVQRTEEVFGEGAASVRLSRTFDGAVDRLRADEPGALDETLAAAGRATLDIESDIVGATSKLAAYRASLVGYLAHEAAAYYEEAVTVDPFDLDGYRFAYGLLREAKNMHEGLATVVEEQTDDHARAADTLLAAMFSAMPSSEPPTDLPPADEVTGAASVLGTLLTDDYGAVSLPPRDGLSYIAPLLEEILVTYESGEAGVADVLLEKVRASLCCPSTSAGDALEIELARLSKAIRSGAADLDIATLVERSSELAADAT